jgi:enoyl-CoA hydratase/carnithine racemase
MDFGGGDEIRFERLGLAGVVTLTRPAALNAVTHGMIKALTAALNAWRNDPAVKLVLVKGEGRAFAAGGDIRAIYEAGRAGRPPVDFFADEYRLNAMIAAWPKPYVALIDGIVMGGGVGISFHGSHRVLTENAVFAMPEVGIGFFPDVGGSHLLSDLGGWFGMYLGLTGTRIRYGDALWSGLATHTTKAEFQAGLIERIAETGDADLALRECFGPARRETDDATLHKIARHFAGPSLHDIVESLEIAAPNDDFARDTLATMKKRSPTSLNVAFRQITAGSTLSIEECMRMEFRILNRMLAGHDFYEGIRAAIIDKGDTPRWVPATLAEVKAAEIDRYFAPLGDRELTLP